MSHFCQFCQMEHTSNSCYHPGQQRIEELEAQADKQKRCRIKYQDIVYKACNLLDKTRTPCPDCTIDQVVSRIKDLQTEIGREYARAEKAEAERDAAIKEIGVQARACG